MTLIERDGQLRTLDELLADAALGKGRVALITGPPATGKTALLAALARQAERSGAVVLRAVATRARRDVPLGVLTQLLSSLPGADDGLRSALSNQDLGRVEQVTAHAVYLLCARLLDLAQERKLVIQVDDVHHADAASVQGLLTLGSRLRSSRTLLALTEVAKPWPVDPMLHAELRRQSHCRWIRVTPLSPLGVQQLLAGQFASCTARRLAWTVYEVTGGNPRLVLAMAEDSGSADDRANRRRARRIGCGPAFSEALCDHLARLGGEALLAARAVAVLGEDAATTLLGRDANRLFAMLTSARILDGVRFRHPDLRAAVIGGTAEEERAELHARVARLLHDAGGQVPVIARHLLAADRADGAWAVRVLTGAAERAVADRDIDLAVACLELAHRDCTDESEGSALKALLMRAEWRIDPSAAAKHISALATATRQGHLNGSHSAGQVKYLLWYGRTAEAAEALSRLRRSADAGDTSAARELRTMQVWLQSSYPELVRHLSADAAAGDAPPVSDARVRPAEPRLLQAATVLSDAIQSGMDKAAFTRAMQILQQQSPMDDGMFAAAMAAMAALVYADKLTEVLPWCTALTERAAASAVPSWQAKLAALRAEIALRQGDLMIAEDSALAAIEHLSARGWGVAFGMPLSVLITASTAMGEQERAAEHLRTPVLDAMFRTTFGLHYIRARGLHRLAGGDAAAALADFRTCGVLTGEWRSDRPEFVPWRSDAAEALLRLGDRDEAGRLAAEQLTLLEGENSRTRGISLRVLAATSGPRRRPQLLRESVDILRDAGDRLELARSLAALSETHQQTGDRDRAAMLARRAFQLADECGAVPLRERLRPLVGADPEPSPAAESADAAGAPAEPLSDAERRVAALAAQGHTNREIALRLSVTVSTVEQHLTRVYRKLQVNRRSALLSAMVDAGLE